MKGKPAIANLKYMYVVNEFNVWSNLFVFSKRKIFNWYDEITTDSYFHDFEFNSLSCKKHSHRKKKRKNLPRNAYGQPFRKPEVILLPEKLRQSSLNNHNIYF